MLKAVLRTAYFDFGAGILVCKGPSLSGLAQ